jgi:hypothetical protein
MAPEVKDEVPLAQQLQALCPNLMLKRKKSSANLEMPVEKVLRSSCSSGSNGGHDGRRHDGDGHDGHDGQASTKKVGADGSDKKGTHKKVGADATDKKVGADGTDQKVGADGTGKKVGADGTDKKGTGKKVGADGTDNKVGADGTDQKVGADGTDKKVGAELALAGIDKKASGTEKTPLVAAPTYMGNNTTTGVGREWATEDFFAAAKLEILGGTPLDCLTQVLTGEHSFASAAVVPHERSILETAKHETVEKPSYTIKYEKIQNRIYRRNNADDTIEYAVAVGPLTLDSQGTDPAYALFKDGNSYPCHFLTVHDAACLTQRPDRPIEKLPPLAKKAAAKKKQDVGETKFYDTILEGEVMRIEMYDKTTENGIRIRVHVKPEGGGLPIIFVREPGQKEKQRLQCTLRQAGSRAAAILVLSAVAEHVRTGMVTLDKKSLEADKKSQLEKLGQLMPAPLAPLAPQGAPEDLFTDPLEVNLGEDQGKSIWEKFVDEEGEEEEVESNAWASGSTENDDDDEDED